MKTKRLLSLLLGIITCFSALVFRPAAAYSSDITVSPDCVKVMLIGNSYIYYNEYGEVLSKLGALSGKKLLVVRVTKPFYGGQNFLENNEIDYKAWYNGAEIDYGENKSLAEITAMDFGNIGRPDSWDAVFSINLLKNTVYIGNVMLYDFFENKLPTPRSFVLHDLHVGKTLSDSQRYYLDLVAEKCGCSIMSTRELFSHYSELFPAEWGTDLVLQEGAYHPTPRGTYLFALSAFTKLFGTDDLPSSATDASHFIRLFNSDNGTAEEFINGGITIKGGVSEEGLTVRKADAIKLQYFVKVNFDSCIGETILYTSSVIPASPEANGSLVLKNIFSKKTTYLPIYAPKAISLSSYILSCNGEELRPDVIVADADGNIIPAEHYSISYANNKKVGVATVSVTFCSERYTGFLTTSFMIRPEAVSIKKVTKLKKGFKVKWKKPKTSVTGYQLQYSTRKDFRKAKTVKIKRAGTLAQTVEKLKSRKKYYIRIKSYKTVKGKVYYSEWSDVKKIKTK